MRAMTTTKSIGYGLAVGIVASSCGTTHRTLHEDHCANQDGNAWCGDKHPDGSRPYCSRGISGCEAAIELNSADLDGCVAERPVDDACYSPCGGRLDVTADASCLGAETSTSESDTSTGGTTESASGSEGSSESSTTGPMPCASDEDCTDDAAPFCEPVRSECVGCDEMTDPDGACAGADPALPLCVRGGCVACTPENPAVCDQALLVCDDESNACVRCEAHGECGSGACELAAGTCFPPGVVVHVDGDGGQDFLSVAAAVASVGAGQYRVIVVHELEMDAEYGMVTINNGKTIALLAAPGEHPIIRGTGMGNPGVRVEGVGTVLYMDGLRVSQSAAQGLVVNGAFAWVDRSRIVQNTGGGVLAQGGADLTLRNCFVGGGGALDVDAVTVNGSTLEMLYTTAGGGAVLGGRARALFCEGANAASVRNSILVSADPMPEVECPGAALTTSVTEGDVGMLNAMWFTGYATGDFHLTASGAAAFADIAEWKAGDPVTDIDGHPRPAVDGTPDYAGADVP
jgi:hypothetical protein